MREDEKASNAGTLLAPLDLGRPQALNPGSSTPNHTTTNEHYAAMDSHAYAGKFQHGQGEMGYAVQTDTSFNEFNEYSSMIWDASGQTFPGWFHTSFDEHTLLPGFGAQVFEASS